MNKNQSYKAGLYFWLSYAAIALVLVSRGPSLEMPFATFNNDDAMRLVQVRDWLGGQNWRDLTQYRLGLDTPVTLHWPRLVDLPLAALMLLFGIFTGPEMAEHLTIVIWPFLVLALFLYAVKRGAEALGGDVAGYVSLFLSFGIVLTTAKFFAGSIDHHNVQMTLIALALWGAFDVERLRWAGLLTGTALALSLVVGLEAIPYVATICVFVALAWAINAQVYTRYVKQFSVGFAGIVMTYFILARPDQTPAEFQCDMLDLGLSKLAVLGAVGLGVTALTIANRSIYLRFLALIVLGAAIIAFAALFVPACLSNPLDQLHDSVKNDWLGRVAESLPVKSFIGSGNPGMFGALVIPFFALGGSLYLAAKPSTRAAGVLLTIGIIMGYALLQYQTRNSIFFLMICTYPLAYGIAIFIRSYQSRKTILGGVAILAGLILSSFPFWGVAFALWNPTPIQTSTLDKAPTNQRTKSNCSDPAEFTFLRSLPSGRIIAQTNYADEILKETPHSAIASNFHRNHDGIKAMLDWSQSDPKDVLEKAQKIGAKYVIYCSSKTGLPENLAGGPMITWEAFFNGNIPEGFSRISPEGDLIQVFQVN